MDVYEVVSILVGPIQPVGATHIDGDRLKNAITLTELVDKLIGDIDRAASNKNRVEDSMKAIGQHCSGFLDDLGIKQ